MDTETLAEKIFALLKGNGLKIKIFDESGAETTDPKDGRRFFAVNPNIMVSINSDSNSIEFNKGGGSNKAVDNLVHSVKQIANEFLMNTKIKIFGKSIRPKDYSYQVKMQRESVMENSAVNHLVLAKVFKELDYAAAMSADAIAANIPGSDLNEVQKALNRLVQDGKVSVSDSPDTGIMYSKRVAEAVGALHESFSRMFGSKRTSRQVLENVGLIIKHKDDVNDEVRGARTRKISSIFLERSGERFKFPHNNLAGARAMAQHLAHGGEMNDSMGSYIIESTGRLMELRAFSRYAMSNQLINEASLPVLETIKTAMAKLKEELKRITGSKTYESVKARIESSDDSAGELADIDGLKEMFTVKRFDERFEGILPLVGKLLKEQESYKRRIEDAANGPVYVKPGKMGSAPVFEFTSENAQLGFKISELAVRITENEELSAFVAEVGNKISKNAEIDAFESAIISRVLENAMINKTTDLQDDTSCELRESKELEAYFDKFDVRFI